MSRRFGRNQKRRLRQALKSSQERSGVIIRGLNDRVARLQKENHNLSFREERLDPHEFDMEASLRSSCGSIETRRKALNMRKFILTRVADRFSLREGGHEYIQHIKKNTKNELFSLLAKHIKIEGEVNHSTGDLVVYASIIAESRTP